MPKRPGNWASLKFKQPMSLNSILVPNCVLESYQIKVLQPSSNPILA